MAVIEPPRKHTSVWVHCPQILLGASRIWLEVYGTAETAWDCELTPPRIVVGVVNGRRGTRAAARGLWGRLVATDGSPGPPTCEEQLLLSKSSSNFFCELRALWTPGSAHPHRGKP